MGALKEMFCSVERIWGSLARKDRLDDDFEPPPTVTDLPSLEGPPGLARVRLWPDGAADERACS